MVKRVGALALLLMLLAVPTYIGVISPVGSLPRLTLAGIASGQYARDMERGFQRNFPLREHFSNLAWNLRYRTGAMEIDGYFITDGGSIIKNVAAPHSSLVRANQKAIRKFAADSGSSQVYQMLLPTACAIKQQELPSFSESVIYSQRDFIEQVNESIADELTPVNVYPVLFSNQDQYLYYHTEDSLTPLGGYYAYSLLAPKLGVSPYGLNQFNVEYVAHDYSGFLSKKFQYAAVAPDILTLYHFANRQANQIYTRSYTLSHINGATESARFTELYNRSALETDQPLNVYFGGIPEVLQLHMRSNAPNSAPNESKLLIIGDDTARSYLPFLTPHYSRIDLVNAVIATPETYEDLDLSLYSQILFAFSTDTYMHCENLTAIGGVV